MSDNDNSEVFISIFNGRERTLGGGKSAVWLKMGVGFREHLHVFTGAQLGVFLAIALHSNEDGWAWPSYIRLAKMVGVNKDTVSRALKALCQATINGQRILLRCQVYDKERGRRVANRYLIFPSAMDIEAFSDKMLDLQYIESQCIESQCIESQGIADRDQNKNYPKPEPVQTKTKEKQQPHDDAKTDVDAQGVLLLAEFGILHSTAIGLAKGCDPEQIRDWVEYARDNELGPGWLVKNMGANDGPPKRESKPAQDNFSKYISGEFADLIQH